jgi:hypothetical protein
MERTVPNAGNNNGKELMLSILASLKAKLVGDDSEASGQFKSWDAHYKYIKANLSGPNLDVGSITNICEAMQLDIAVRFALYFDGEENQLQSAMSEDIQAIYKSLGINLNKLNASRSSSEQVCDVGPVFRDLKANIRRHTNGSVSIPNDPAVAARVQRIINTLNTNMKKTNSNSKPLDSKHKKCVTTAFEFAKQFLWKVSNGANVVTSFEKPGWISAHELKVMGLLTAASLSMTNEDLAAFIYAIPYIVGLVRLWGRVEEADFRLNIGEDVLGKQRNLYHKLSSNRATEISHEQQIRHEQYVFFVETQDAARKKIG